MKSFLSNFKSPRDCNNSAASKRTRPKIEQAFSHSLAAKKTISPFSIFNSAFSLSCSSCDKNFKMGDFHSPSTALIKAKPLAPRDLALSSSFFSSPCVISDKPFTFMAFTDPPDWIVPANTLKSDFSKIGLQSTSSMSKRISGLSTPKRFIASM